MKKLFGTDGIRARANEFPLDYGSVYTLGKALVSLLKRERLDPQIIIGRDTRESGIWIEEALHHGLRDSGGKVYSAGVIPTSAISILTRKHGFGAGIVISASHNPYEDNGIKIFSRKGMKIDDEWEESLEEAIINQKKRVEKKNIEISPNPRFSQEYIDFLKKNFSLSPLPRKIKVILDCSNGAGSNFAPRVLRELGFEVKALFATPNGKNINDCCGSLYPQTLAKKVVEEKADIGIAYDGDADRAVWVDEKGRILNGDHTLFVLSRFMKEKKTLKSEFVVATTMSNLGLELALKRLNLRLFRTQVGDKYVLEQMLNLKTNLGGEQSGHTIFLDDCQTGDGILTSLKMLEAMLSVNSPLSTLVEDFEEFPQVLMNVRVARKVDFSLFPEITSTVEEIKKSLGVSGRVNLRYSGTEHVARIMIEGKERAEIERHAQRLASVIEKNLGPKNS